MRLKVYDFSFLYRFHERNFISEVVDIFHIYSQSIISHYNEVTFLKRLFFIHPVPENLRPGKNETMGRQYDMCVMLEDEKNTSCFHLSIVANEFIYLKQDVFAISFEYHVRTSSLCKKIHRWGIVCWFFARIKYPFISAARYVLNCSKLFIKLTPNKSSVFPLVVSLKISSFFKHLPRCAFWKKITNLLTARNERTLVTRSYATGRNLLKEIVTLEILRLSFG